MLTFAEVTIIFWYNPVFQTDLWVGLPPKLIFGHGPFNDFRSHFNKFFGPHAAPRKRNWIHRCRSLARGSPGSLQLVKWEPGPPSNRAGTSTGAVLVRPANGTSLAQSAWKNMGTVGKQKSVRKNPESTSCQKLFGSFNPPKERENHSSSQKTGKQRARLKTKDTFKHS